MAEKEKPTSPQKSLLGIQIEEAKPEELLSTRAALSRRAQEEIKQALSDLKPGQKFSIPKQYRHHVTALRQSEEFQSWVIAVSVRKEDTFCKVIRKA